MRAWKNSLLCLLLISLALLPACGDDDDNGSVTDPPPETISIEDAVGGYWAAQQGVSGELSEMTRVWNEIEAAFSDKASDDEIEELVNQYVARAEAAAAEFDTLLSLENAIVPYGTDKGMFTDFAKAVVVGVYNVGKKAVVSSGQMVRTGWRVLSGSHSLRQALRAPDSGIPIVSDMARRLQEHNARRDDVIVQSIMDGNDQGGNVPIGELEGDTPEERAQFYRNLSDEHPLKMSTRGAVRIWDYDETQATVTTLKKAAQDQIKNYAGAVGGSEVLVEVGDQMLNPDQPTGDRIPVDISLRDESTSQPVDDDVIIIISKRNQPEEKPKVAVLEDVTPDLDLELPTGEYDVVVIAEDFIRGVEGAIDVGAAVAEDLLFEMFTIVANSLILENVVATPDVAGTGEQVDLRASAISTVGQALSFAWAATGPADATVSGSGSDAVFTADTPGDYVVTVTVTDGLGNEKEATAAIQVIGADVEVGSVDVGDGAFADGELNPGETVSLTLTLVSLADVEVAFDASLAPSGGAEIVSGATETFTLSAGGSTTWPVTIALPVDFSRDTAVFTATLSTDEANIEQEIHLPVAFYVEINPISSPVTDRVFSVSGRVANPSLSSAFLALEGDIGQVFEVALNNGSFTQSIVLEGAAGEQSLNLWLVADSGGWREEDSVDFTADIEPAAFRVTLSWDTDETDVDLWVTDPSGELCFYNNPTTASGLVLDVDDINGYGPENITNLAPPAGDYLVQVHYYSDHDHEQAIGSNCQIVIRLNEGTDDEQLATYSGFLGDTGDMWTVTTITIGDKSLASFGDVNAYSQVSVEDLPTKP